MSILFEDIQLRYCHLTESIVDKLSGKEVYKVQARIPNTPENREKLLKELVDSRDWAKENKAAVLALKGKKGLPEPKVYDIDKRVSEDGRFIDLDLSVQQPIKVFNRYGDDVPTCPVRKVNHADIQIFAYAWTFGSGWGVKLCPKAVCIKEDIAELLRDQEDPSGNASSAFKFATKRVDSDNPFV